MKTKILLSFAGLIALILPAFTATHIIVNSGFSFSPSAVVIDQGDTVIFTLGSSHNAVEVSKETWDANGTASNGGFSLGFGGGQLVFNSPGIFYYVCTPHASLGMKGVITVTGATGISPILSNTGIPEVGPVYPNPFSDKLTISFTTAEPSIVQIDLLDITGNIVQQLTKLPYMAGEHVEDFNLSFLKPGQYILLFDANSKSTAKSIIKIE